MTQLASVLDRLTQFSFAGIATIFQLLSTKFYSTGHSQHNTDFAKTNQNEVMQIRTNFFEDFGILKLIRENEFVILNL